MDRTDLGQWKPKEVARLLRLIETQRRYYQDLVASVPVGLVVLSSDWVIKLANAAARKALGLPGGEAPRGRLDKLFPAWLLDRIEQVLKNGAGQTGIFVELERGKRRSRISILPMRNWDDEAAPEALLSIEEVTGLRLPAAAEAPNTPAVPVICQPIS